MSWEEEEFARNYVRPRVWQENVAALAQVTPSGRFTTTDPATGRTVELNPDVESHFLSFLTPNRLTARRRTPANLLKAERFKRNIKNSANAVTARRQRREMEERRERAQLNARPRVWQENVAALARVTPSGRFATKSRITGRTVELNPDAESHFLSFLTPSRLTARRRTPANLLKAERFKQNIKRSANAVTARRELKERMERLRLQREAEEVLRQEAQDIEDERVRLFIEEQGRKANMEEYVRNTNLRSSAAYRAAVQKKQQRNAITKSRARRGSTKQGQTKRK